MRYPRLGWWFYFYRLNGLMIRFFTDRTLVWISLGYKAEWQFCITPYWWITWPKKHHKMAIWALGFIHLSHDREEHTISGMHKK